MIASPNRTCCSHSDGINQQQFVAINPDTFPAIPSQSSLESSGATADPHDQQFAASSVPDAIRR